MELPRRRAAGKSPGPGAVVRTPHTPWWLEWELWALVLLVGAMYLTRLGAAPFSGEETRRAQIAREMGLWNDWIVPRQQGEPPLRTPAESRWST